MTYKKLKLGNVELDYVDDYKYLGLTIDTGLTFKTHINNLINTISFKVSQLRRIRKSLTNKIALQLYKSMILPVMDYGDLFYQNKNRKLLNKLNVLQNRSVRIISKLPKLTNTDSELKKLDLIPLSNRRALHTLQFAFDLVKCKPHLTVQFDDTSSLERMHTRSHNPYRNQFNIFRPTKSKIERSISYTMRKAWNALPSDVHQLEDKITLSNYLLLNSRYLEF